VSRPTKAVVEYFAHRCRHGRVIFVLESLWGNDGYAFFYKIYELLGDSEGHVFDLNKAGNRDYLIAHTRLSGDIVDGMLDKLVELGIIDGELRRVGVVWSQCFVDDLREVYSRRKVNIPVKPVLMHTETRVDGINDGRNPHSIVKESKEDKSKDISPSGDTSSEDPTTVCPHQEIIDLYHEKLPTLPHIREWTKQRQALLRMRWKEKPERQNLDFWPFFFLFLKCIWI